MLKFNNVTKLITLITSFWFRRTWRMPKSTWRLRRWNSSSLQTGIPLEMSSVELPQLTRSWKFFKLVLKLAKKNFEQNYHFSTARLQRSTESRRNVYFVPLTATKKYTAFSKWADQHDNDAKNDYMITSVLVRQIIVVTTGANVITLS